MADVRIARSSIHGLGVFASRDFAAGETVLTLDDSRLVDESDPMRDDLGEFRHHLDFLANGTVILMQPPERRINSSCDPNAFVQTSGGIRNVKARRPISRGEEITYDYIINSHGGEIWQCNCRSPRCRKTIASSFFDLPLEFQREYLPLLDGWFVEEHREKIDGLRSQLEV